MNKIIAYIFFSLLPAAVLAQSNSKVQDSFRLTKIIAGDYIAVEVDGIGNMYLITAGNQLKKLSPSGDSLAVFNDVRRYGNVSYVDVSNPLRTLIYYKNFSTIIIADRLLSVRTTLNLRKQQVFRVNAVTTSYDNNIWIFDEQNIKLKKINESGKTLLESNDLRLMTEKIPSATFLLDADNFIYLYDPEQGLFIFDQYTVFKYALPYLHWTSVTVSNKTLLGIAGKQLQMYNMDTKILTSVGLPATFDSAISIRVRNNKIFVLNKEGLCIYELP